MTAKNLMILESRAPTLTVPSTPVDLAKLDEVQELIDDMAYTMFFHEGVGLAAPQVGRNIRMFIIDQRPVNGNKRSDPWVFINPKIEPTSDDLLVRPEGCLSFPGVIAEVARPDWVKITAFDRKGEEFSMDTTHNHLFSVALQHEYDHLEGILLRDRATGKAKRGIKKWESQRMLQALGMRP